MLAALQYTGSQSNPDLKLKFFFKIQDIYCHMHSKQTVTPYNENLTLLVHPTQVKYRNIKINKYLEKTNKFGTGEEC